MWGSLPVSSPGFSRWPDVVLVAHLHPAPRPVLPAEPLLLHVPARPPVAAAAHPDSAAAAAPTPPPPARAQPPGPCLTLPGPALPSLRLHSRLSVCCGLSRPIPKQKSDLSHELGGLCPGHCAVRVSTSGSCLVPLLLCCATRGDTGMQSWAVSPKPKWLTEWVLH